MEDSALSRSRLVGLGIGSLATAAIAVGLGVTNARHSRESWEYQILTLSNVDDSRGNEVSLNKLGAEGWELVAVTSYVTGFEISSSFGIGNPVEMRIESKPQPPAIGDVSRPWGFVKSPGAIRIEQRWSRSEQSPPVRVSATIAYLRRLRQQ